MISRHCLICSLFAQLFFSDGTSNGFVKCFDCRQSVWLKCFVFSAQSAQMAEPESSSSGGESGADGGEEEVHKGRARPASVVSSATGLVISHDHRKPRTCLLCNSTSSDDSPLEVTEEAAVDMALPWRSYDKVKQDDGDTVRVPSGKLCLICFNVYRAFGLATEPGYSFCFGSCLGLPEFVFPQSVAQSKID